MIETPKPDSFYRDSTELAASRRRRAPSPKSRRRTTTCKPFSSSWSNEHHDTRNPDWNIRPRPRPSMPGLDSPGSALCDGSPSRLRSVARPDAVVAADDLLGLVVGSPVALGLMLRILDAFGFGGNIRCGGGAVNGSAVFGSMIWLLYIRFIVPVLGVFYGTSLIADEVDDKTITYLFVRPISRTAVLVGSTWSVSTTIFAVLPSVVAVRRAAARPPGRWPRDSWACSPTPAARPAWSHGALSAAVGLRVQAAARIRTDSSCLAGSSWRWRSALRKLTIAYSVCWCPMSCRGPGQRLPSAVPRRSRPLTTLFAVIAIF